ncbi:hypothetical protein VTN49DRAFT_600 [Thermomyces lanuginosus]|uniref:uncharacterized protein n=1 Tax=Thermomyces lanuginosus TaxID=5541 RepID=UPI0037429FD5
MAARYPRSIGWNIDRRKPRSDPKDSRAIGNATEASNLFRNATVLLTGFGYGVGSMRDADELGFMMSCWEQVPKVTLNQKLTLELHPKLESWTMARELFLLSAVYLPQA